MGPGVKAGAVEQSIALNIDLMPTFTELAGGAPDLAVDGGSLVPLLLHGTMLVSLSSSQLPLATKRAAWYDAQFCERAFSLELSVRPSAWTGV
jgi:arylsulfatase A-like enzyme